MLTNDNEIDAVSKFRNETLSHFLPFWGPDPKCAGTDVEPSGRYDNGKFCMIYDHDITNDTLGPFPIGEWSVFVPVHYLYAVMPWFVQHRGQFSLLVHPNTGCEYEDHSIWAQVLLFITNALPYPYSFVNTACPLFLLYFILRSGLVVHGAWTFLSSPKVNRLTNLEKS